MRRIARMRRIAHRGATDRRPRHPMMFLNEGRTNSIARDGLRGRMSLLGARNDLHHPFNPPYPVEPLS